MANNTFMDKLRSFFGFRHEPPRNDFRNPIWGSDDEDDGDELYTRDHMKIYSDAMDMHREFMRQMHDMFETFGSMFGDMKTFFHDGQFEQFPSIAELPSEDDGFNNASIRDYYLKPGFHSKRHEQPKEDMDLDGQISSNDISGLLKQKEDGQNMHSVVPFSGKMVPGRSFCQTIITTSVTKPDGTVETKKIIKNGNEVIEETTTTSALNSRSPTGLNVDQIVTSGIIYDHVISELSSLFRNFY